ncbi:MAG: TMEM175 family protein [Phormidesmis sp.]
MTQETPKKDTRMLLNRLQFLSDGVFILTMTLMVIQFDLPAVEAAIGTTGSSGLWHTLADTIGLYIITFIWIAFYWIENVAQFQYYQRTDSVHVWIQLLYVMCVAVIPYSNAIATKYGSDNRIQLLLNINIIVIGIFSALNWIYATYNHRLVSADLDQKVIANGRIKSLMEPGIALICTGLGLLSPALWDAWLLLFPLGYFIFEWRGSKE